MGSAGSKAGPGRAPTAYAPLHPSYRVPGGSGPPEASPGTQRPGGSAGAAEVAAPGPGGPVLAAGPPACGSGHQPPGGQPGFKGKLKAAPTWQLVEARRVLARKVAGNSDLAALAGVDAELAERCAAGGAMQPKGLVWRTCGQKEAAGLLRAQIDKTAAAIASITSGPQRGSLLRDDNNCARQARGDSQEAGGGKATRPEQVHRAPSGSGLPPAADAASRSPSCRQPPDAAQRDAGADEPRQLSPGGSYGDLGGADLWGGEAAEEGGQAELGADQASPHTAALDAPAAPRPPRAQQPASPRATRSRSQARETQAAVAGGVRHGSGRRSARGSKRKAAGAGPGHAGPRGQAGEPSNTILSAAADAAGNVATARHMCELLALEGLDVSASKGVMSSVRRVGIVLARVAVELFHLKDLSALTILLGDAGLPHAEPLEVTVALGSTARIKVSVECASFVRTRSPVGDLRQRTQRVLAQLNGVCGALRKLLPEGCDLEGLLNRVEVEIRDLLNNNGGCGEGAAAAAAAVPTQRWKQLRQALHAGGWGGRLQMRVGQRIWGLPAEDGSLGAEVQGGEAPRGAGGGQDAGSGGAQACNAEGSGAEAGGAGEAAGEAGSRQAVLARLLQLGPLAGRSPSRPCVAKRQCSRLAILEAALNWVDGTVLHRARRVARLLVWRNNSCGQDTLAVCLALAILPRLPASEVPYTERFKLLMELFVAAREEAAGGPGSQPEVMASLSERLQQLVAAKYAGVADDQDWRRGSYTDLRYLLHIFQQEPQEQALSCFRSARCPACGHLVEPDGAGEGRLFGFVPIASELAGSSSSPLGATARRVFNVGAALQAREGGLCASSRCSGCPALTPAAGVHSCGPPAVLAVQLQRGTSTSGFVAQISSPRALPISRSGRPASSVGSAELVAHSAPVTAPALPDLGPAGQHLEFQGKHYQLRAVHILSDQHHTAYVHAAELAPRGAPAGWYFFDDTHGLRYLGPQLCMAHNPSDVGLLLYQRGE